VSTAGIPTKTLREGAIYLSGLGQSVIGLPPASAADSWRLLMTRKLEVSEFMTKAVERNLVRHGIERIRGRARFLPGRRVEVDKVEGGEEVVLEADVVLLATGSRPRHPPGIPMDDPDVHDSESILGIERAPQSILVIGGGSLGCEYASIFAGLGVQVTVVDAGSHLLPALDVEMARVLAESFNSMGIRVIPMVSVSGVAREGDALEASLADGRTLRARKVLVAAGRRPQIEGPGAHGSRSRSRLRRMGSGRRALRNHRSRSVRRRRCDRFSRFSVHGDGAGTGCGLSRFRLRVQAGDRSLPTEVRVLDSRGGLGRPHGGTGARIWDCLRGRSILVRYERESADLGVPGRSR
jgi:Pyridine nucleotide-disulphide oxidoreductase